MKKSRVLAVMGVLFLMPIMETKAQMLVTAPVLEAISSSAQIENAIKYALMVQQQVQQIEQAYNQFQNMLRMEKMAMDNLKSVSKVSSYGDFMKWYNRQLYLERKSEEKFMSMGVSIGGNNYTMKNIIEIPNALKTQFVDHDFSKALTPQERKKLWADLGLHPANYVYLQTWQERNKKIGAFLATSFSDVTAENEETAKRYEALSAAYDADKDKAEDEKLSEKSLLMDGNKLQLEANLIGLKANELKAAEIEFNYNKHMEENAPPNAPHISETFNESPFVPIVEDVNVSYDEE